MLLFSNPPTDLIKNPGKRTATLAEEKRYAIP
jgi:hypothetical protein